MLRNKCFFPGSNITCFTIYIHLWPIYWLSLAALFFYIWIQPTWMVKSVLKDKSSLFNCTSVEHWLEQYFNKITLFMWGSHRMPSFGMCCHVVCNSTHFLFLAPTCSLCAPLQAYIWSWFSLHASLCLLITDCVLRLLLPLEAVHSFKTLNFYWAIHHHIPEDSTL
jgi:hypothetical protein